MRAEGFEVSPSLLFCLFVWSQSDACQNWANVSDRALLLDGHSRALSAGLSYECLNGSMSSLDFVSSSTWDHLAAFGNCVWLARTMLCALRLMD